MFCHLRAAQWHEIEYKGGGGRAKKRWKKAKKGVFFKNFMTQLNTNAITNLNTMSLGSLGSSGFTASGHWIMALGINIVFEQFAMVMFF